MRVRPEPGESTQDADVLKDVLHLEPGVGLDVVPQVHHRCDGEEDGEAAGPRRPHHVERWDGC